MLSTLWSSHASQWQRIGSPLRPSPEDSAIMWGLAQPALRELSRVIVLGVTPEIVQMPWPTATELVAVDKSQEMIARVWTPNPRVASSRVQHASWQSIPLPARWANLIVGDGSFNALASLEECRGLFADLANVLEPDGVIIARFFVSPHRPASVEAVVEAALSGHVESFHTLKWQLATALAINPSRSVPVQEIYRAFNSSFRDRSALSRATGWPTEVIATIDAYADSEASYTFPTRTEVAAICQPHFELDEARTGRYEWAEHCPTMRFRRTSTTARGR